MFGQMKILPASFLMSLNGRKEAKDRLLNNCSSYV